MEFGYWGVKGLFEPVRWLVAHLGLESKETNPKSGEEWGQLKSTLHLDFPNLPYLIDGDVKLTESSALPIYIVGKAGRKDLLGNNIAETAQIRQIEGVLSDLKQNFMKVVFGSGDRNEAMAKALEPTGSSAQKIQHLSKFLGTKDYLFGHVTYADLLLVYTMHMTGAIAQSLGQKCPWCEHKNLMDLERRVVSLPGIKERYNSALKTDFIVPQYVPFKLATTAECFPAA